MLTLLCSLSQIIGISFLLLTFVSYAGFCAYFKVNCVSFTEVDKSAKGNNIIVKKSVVRERIREENRGIKTHSVAKLRFVQGWMQWWNNEEWEMALGAAHD